MRWCPDPTGRFPERPFYEKVELDQECERRIENFLGKRRKVQYPITTNELCILIEEAAAELDLYADLSHRGPNVQGETAFATKGKPTVRIIEELQDPRRENRLRTTLTHELAHVVFHNYLYGLYLGVPSPCCTEASMLGAPMVDWMEWQAGYCSGSFLMPARALTRVIRDAQHDRRISGSPSVATTEANHLIERVMEAFQVSTDAARVRLLHRGTLTE